MKGGWAVTVTSATLFLFFHNKGNLIYIHFMFCLVKWD